MPLLGEKEQIQCERQSAVLTGCQVSPSDGEAVIASREPFQFKLALT